MAIDLGAYKSAVAPTFIDLGTVDGRLVGAFIKTTAKGLIWYDPSVFQGAAPGTWDELQRAAQATATGGTRPWCVGLASGESSGWPGTDWIENLVIRQSGPDVYDRWVAGDVAWTSREIRRAFEAYGQVVEDKVVFGGRDGAMAADFTTVGDALFTSPPGCVFLQQGSFIVPFLAHSNRAPGVDFDFFPFPEVNPAFDGSVVGAGDLIVLMTDKPAARGLMAFLLSDEAQTAWAETGAALSVDSRVAAYPSEIATRMARVLTSAEEFRFDGSDAMPAAMQSAFLRAILDFTADQRRLPDILARLDAVQAQAYGG
jgi:alpha-glucoside transport system substrate-binding protein